MTDFEPQRQFWNQRFGAEAYAYGTEPNDFLVQAIARAALPAGAPVLCLGDGEGRNGVWLARQGFAVTTVDLADEGVRKSQALAARAGVAVDARRGDATTFALEPGAWAAIVCIFLHLPPAERRALHRRCAAALAPGGVLVVEAYTPAQLALGTGGPKDEALLPTLADLEADAEGLAIEHRFDGRRRVVEGTLHTGEAAVAQLMARRPSASA